MARQINLRVSDNLLQAVDEDRGDVPRNRYIVRLLEGALGVSETPKRPVTQIDPALKEPADPKIAAQQERDAPLNRPVPPGGITERGEVFDAVKPASEVRYRCQRCEFTAKVPSACCPNHPGKLVAG